MLKTKSNNLITNGRHLPYNPDLKERARVLRKNMTPAEKKLWHEYLRNFHYPVLRQKPIDHFIVDFYCAKLKLVIEVDGDTHYTNEGLLYDKRRTEILEKYDLKVLRFTNHEVMNSFESVIHIIESQISNPPDPL
ncbi:endonuclease domain-containing protein [bacterium]|nr:endonuclease domain-containing protein [bacterium]